MDAYQRSALGQITEDQRERGIDPSAAVQNFTLESQELELPPPGRHAGGDNTSDCDYWRHFILPFNSVSRLLGVREVRRARGCLDLRRADGRLRGGRLHDQHGAWGILDDLL